MVNEFKFLAQQTHLGDGREAVDYCICRVVFRLLLAPCSAEWHVSLKLHKSSKMEISNVYLG